MSLQTNKVQVISTKEGDIGMEVEILTNEPNKHVSTTPIHDVRVSLMPGKVNDPEILFGEAIRIGYSAVLDFYHKTPHDDDQVRLAIEKHDGLDNEYWSSGNYSMVSKGTTNEAPEEKEYKEGRSAVDMIVDDWLHTMQSAEDIDLANGPLVIALQFTLISQGAYQGTRNVVGGKRPVTYQRPTYKETKEKMWRRCHTDDWFFNNAAMMYTPFTVDNLCFAMSFVIAQCRYLKKDAQGKIIDVLESPPSYQWERIPQTIQRSMDAYLFFHPNNQAILQQLDQNIEGFHFLYRDQLVLFNPCKPFEANGRYATSRTFIRDVKNMRTDFFDSWVLLAQATVSEAEHRLGRNINIQNLDDIGPAFAEAFQVHIHIRRTQLCGEQSEVFRPTNYPNHEHERHISIMFGDSEGNHEHCHAVTNIRDWNFNQKTAHHSNISNYCDYCCVQVGANNRNKIQSLKHINECRVLYVENPTLKNKKKKENASGRRDRFRICQKGGGNSKDRNLEKKKYCVMCQLILNSVEEEQQHLNHGELRDEVLYECNVCLEKVIRSMFHHHLCYIPTPKENQPNYKELFVFDCEASQARSEDNPNIYIHTCNLVCFRSVMDPTYRHVFPTIDAFLQHVMNDRRCSNSVILGHNAGSYDCQFIVQYLESHLIEFDTLPRPGCVHKYLHLRIDGKTKGEDITFKDFMMFMPGSLKSIAEAFQLPIQKGDFPHLFNTVDHMEYEGAIPPMESEEDYYGLRGKKNEKEVEELKQWFRDQCQTYCSCSTYESRDHDTCIHCSKKAWKFQEQLEKYCWLDVDVLAEAVKHFQEAHLHFGDEGIESLSIPWIPSNVDPFEFDTQSQIAMYMFLRGHQNNPQKLAISQPKFKHGWSQKSLLWLNHMQHGNEHHIQHIGNSEKEYFDPWTMSFVDGYASSSNTVYEFLGCYYHGCPHCFDPNRLHPQKHIPYHELYQNTMKKIDKLRLQYNQVIYIWECQFDRIQCDVCESSYQKELCNIILDREMFFGGRVEVFSPYCRVQDTPEETIQYHDVCSLYPTVCSHDPLPIGYPIRYFGVEAEMQRTRFHEGEDGIFGYIRCRVVCPKHDILGLLATKHGNQRLTFDLLDKVGTYFSRELYLAMSVGYQITDIFEILHWTPDQRSNDYFKGYMSFFLRQKQEAEGWIKAGASSENPTEDEQNRVIEELYQLNGRIGRMRNDRVRKNPVMRQLAKIYLNCLWGKFGQKPGKMDQTLVYGYQSFLDIRYNPEIDQESVRYRKMNGDTFRAYYQKHMEYATANRRYNVWLASAVTANARVRLHSQMLKIGPDRVLYCDTDSIIFMWPTNVPSLASKGLGNWVDEMSGDNRIVEFIGLAPKTYMLCISDGSNHIKAKGIRMTISNKITTTPESVRLLLAPYLVGNIMYIDPKDKVLELDHMTIAPNSTNSDYEYATLFTRYGQKKLRAVFSKRDIIPFLTVEDRQQMNFLMNSCIDPIASLDDFIEKFDFETFERIYCVPKGYEMSGEEHFYSRNRSRFHEWLKDWEEHKNYLEELNSGGVVERKTNE